jgi:hypothetical protein
MEVDHLMCDDDGPLMLFSAQQRHQGKDATFSIIVDKPWSANQNGNQRRTLRERKIKSGQPFSL